MSPLFARLLNDILDFSRVQAGKWTLQKVRFDLRDASGERPPLRDRGARKGLEFKVLLADDLPESVLGVPGRLHRI